MNYKKLTFFLFMCLHIQCLAQDFSIGWANLGTRFYPAKNDRNYSNYDVLSPGFELQLSYHYCDNLAFITGASYQSLFFRSPIDRRSYNSPPFVASLLDKALCIPALIKYNFLKLGASTHVGITTGIYFAFPLYHQTTYYSAGNPKIFGDDEARVGYDFLYKYSYGYMGCGISRTLNTKYEIYAEPFVCNILKEVRDGSLVTQKYRNNFWYGIKIGINYSFKIKNNEN